MRLDRILLFTLFAVSLGPASAGTRPAECQPSVWSLQNQSLRRDGSMAESDASSTRYCLLDGDLEMDEFRALDGSGKTIFRGVSFTFPMGASGEHRTLWVMVGDAGNTLIVNHLDGDSTVSTGHGLDGLGRFDEESTTTYPAPDRYRFEMDRKYESIGQWLRPFNIIEGKRTGTTPPNLPDHPATALRGLKELIPAFGTRAGSSDESLYYSYVLDGYAHVSIERRDAGDGTGPPLLRYVVPVDNSELLIYEWVLGTDQLDSRRKSRS